MERAKKSSTRCRDIRHAVTCLGFLGFLLVLLVLGCAFDSRNDVVEGIVQDLSFDDFRRIQWPIAFGLDVVESNHVVDSVACVEEEEEEEQ